MTAFYLNFPSVRDVLLSETTQIAIYGYQECRYEDLIDELKYPVGNRSSPVQKIFDYQIGVNPQPKNNKITTLEGRRMRQITYPTNSIDSTLDEKQVKLLERQQNSRSYKAGLNTIVLENYLRRKEGLPLIQLLFVVDTDDNEYPLTPESLCSREVKINECYTHKELRRIYKMCFLSDPSFREIAEIAKATLIFVALTPTDHLHEEEDYLLKIDGTITHTHRRYIEYRLEKKVIPWDQPDWTNAWSTRRKAKITKPKENDWRLQMKNLLGISNGE